MSRFLSKKAGRVSGLVLISAALALLFSCGPKISFENLEEFRDPNNRFVVKLPKGYVLENKSEGERTKINLKYPNGYHITFISNAMTDGEWDRDAAMLKKVSQIKDGQFPYPDMKLVKCDRMDFGGGKGYYIQMQGMADGKNTRLIAYALVGNGNSFSMSLVCTEKDQCRTFRDTIENTFVIQ